MPRWMWVVGALACNGGGSDSDSTATPAGCAASAECGSGLVCIGTATDLGCGIPPLEECDTNEACGGTEVCHAIVDSCSLDGFGSVCASPCGSDEECGPGLTCETGACRVVTCAEEPGACTPWEQCDAPKDGGVLSQNDGCTTIPCTDDGPCGVGACVNGFCQSARGECGPPLLPVP